MSIISISNERLTVSISTLGAELQSVKGTDGVERLWQGDPAYWTGRAPVLFPVCGGLKDDTCYFEGQPLKLAKHGFARRSEWTVETREADAAVLLLNVPNPGFPFAYELRAGYRLEGSALRVTYTVRNLDSRDFLCSLGSHEAWAIEGPLEDYTLVFDRPETLANYQLVGNLIKTEPEILAQNITELPLKTEYFAVDALVFPHLVSRGATLRSDRHSHSVRMDYEGMDVLMLWTKPGARYFCIEPWCNAPDYMDTDQQLEHKPGMLRVAPGGEVSRTHLITLG